MTLDREFPDGYASGLNWEGLPLVFPDVGPSADP